MRISAITDQQIHVDTVDELTVHFWYSNSVTSLVVFADIEPFIHDLETPYKPRLRGQRDEANLEWSVGVTRVLPLQRFIGKRLRTFTE